MRLVPAGSPEQAAKDLELSQKIGTVEVFVYEVTGWTKEEHAQERIVPTTPTQLSGKAVMAADLSHVTT